MNYRLKEKIPAPILLGLILIGTNMVWVGLAVMLYGYGAKIFGPTVAVLTIGPLCGGLSTYIIMEKNLGRLTAGIVAVLDFIFIFIASMIVSVNIFGE